MNFGLRLDEIVWKTLRRHRKMLNGPVPSDILYSEKEPTDIIFDEAKQALLDWHNKQIEAMLDRLEQSFDTHTTPYERDLLTKRYVRNTLNFERNKLKEVK